MSKIDQIKIPVAIVTEESESQIIFKLIRINDGLVRQGQTIKYVEWEGGIGSKAKELHDEPAVGRSLVLNPGLSYNWLTTSITEIVEQRENYIKFKTQNSDYELFKIN